MKKILLLIIAAFTMISSYATVYYWDGSGAFNNPSSWWLNRNGTGTPQPSNFTTAADIFIVQGTGATTNGVGTGASNQILTANATWTFAAGVTLEVEGGATLNATALIPSLGTFIVNNTGNYIHNATPTGISGATTDFPGTTRTLGASSNVTILQWGGTAPALIPAITYGNLTFSPTTTWGGSMQMNATLSTIQGNLTVTATGGTTREFRLTGTNALNFTVGGNLAVSGGIFKVATNNAQCNVTVSGTTTVSGTGLFDACGTGNTNFTTLTGNVLVSGGTFELAATGSVTTPKLVMGGNLTVNGGVFQPGSNFVSYTTSVAGKVDATAGSLVINPSTTTTGANFSVNGNFNVAGAAVTCLNGTSTVTVGGSLQVSSGSFVMSGSTSVTTINVNSDISVTSTGTITCAGVVAYTVGGNVTINTSAGITKSSALQFTMTCTGNFNLQSGTFSFQNNNSAGGPLVLNVGGNFNMTGGIFTGGNSTVGKAVVNFTGGVNTTPTYTQSAGTITASRPIDYTIATGKTLTLNNDISLITNTLVSDFKVNNGAVLICCTNKILGAGTFTLGATGKLNIGDVAGITLSPTATGSIQCTSTRTFPPTADYEYCGSSGQITGTGLPASVNNLTISNSSNVTLTAAVTVNGKLAFTTGKLILGTKNIIVTNPLIAAVPSITGVPSFGSTSNSYIVVDNTGTFTIKSLTNATGNVLFPVGPSTSLYNPVQMNNSGTTSDITVLVTTADINLSPSIAPVSVKNTWTFTASSTPTIALGLQWSDDGTKTGINENTGFIRNNCSVIQFTTSAIVNTPAYSAASGTGPFTQSFTGITTIGTTSTTWGVTCKASTITNTTGYVYSSNIPYKDYQANPMPATTAATSSIGVMGLTINDFGADSKTTTLTAITFTIPSTSGDIIRNAALYDVATGNKIAGSDIAVFNGATSLAFSGISIVCSDNSTKNFELRVSFKTAVTDNTQMQFTVSAVTASALGTIFSTADAGAAASSIVGDINRIEVTATKLAWGVQPTNTPASTIITPNVVVNAVDLHNNIDLDYNTTVTITSTTAVPSPCGSATLSGNTGVALASGVATFTALSPLVQDVNVTLTATDLGGTPITATPVSNLFDVTSGSVNTTIAKWDFPNNPDDAIADAASTNNLIKTISTVGGTSAISFSTGGSTSNSASATGWDAGNATKYFQVDISTTGYSDITLSSNQRSSGTGPKDFKTQYKIGVGGAWTDFGSAITVANNYTSGRITDVALPAACNNQAQIFIRWIMTSNFDISGVSSVVSGGVSNIDDIVVKANVITAAAAIYYQTKASGAWESPCTWETSTTGSAPWIAAIAAPDFTAKTITLLSTHSVSINSAIAVDELTVATGATLTLNDKVLTINNGTGTDFTVNGTFIDNASSANNNIFNTSATWALGNTATFIKTRNSSAANYRDFYEGGMSNIPATANWIIRYTAASDVTFTTTGGTYYPNLTFENSSATNPYTFGNQFSGSSDYARVKGNLDIGGTTYTNGVVVTNINSNATPMLVSGNLIVRNGSTFTNAGTTNGTGLEVKGDVTVKGTLTLNNGSTGILKMSGSAAQGIYGTGALNLNNLEIANTSTGVTMYRNVTSGGTATFTSGALIINGNTLEVNNAGWGTGTLTGSSTSNLTIDGNGGTMKFTGGATTLKDLTLNSAATATVGDNLDITAGAAAGSVTLNGALTTLYTNDKITLKSDANGTARFGQFPVGCTITGKFIIERYLPMSTSYNSRRWRLLTTPINNTGTPTISSTWQEGAVPTSTTTDITLSTNPSPGYGTHITNGVTPANGFDAGSTANSSIFYMSGGLWAKPTATNGSSATAGLISPKAGPQGYMVFVRGDRSIVVSGQYIGTTGGSWLRSKGELITGDYSVSIAGGKQVIANPYASAISFNNVTYNGVIPASTAGTGLSYYLWDPKMQGNYNVGGFVTFSSNGSSGTYGSPSAYIYAPYTGAFPSGMSGYSTDGTIESGEAFMINAPSSYAGTNNFIIHETDKVSNSSSIGIASRPAATNAAPFSVLYTNLYSYNNSASTPLLADGVATAFGADYNNVVDAQDATKLLTFNTKEKVSIIRDGKLLAIERRNSITDADTIYLSTNVDLNHAYQFQLIGKDFDASLHAYMVDNYLHTNTPIAVNGDITYNFNTTADVLSNDVNRFAIVFKPGNALPVTITKLNANQQNGAIAVNWNVANQQGIKQYEIEKSTDGIHFTNQAIVAAVNNTAAYNWLDKSINDGLNYYRIKLVNEGGSIAYSSIVKIVVGKSTPSVTIASTIISNGIINLQMNNLPKGKYFARVINNLGQTLLTEQITHNGGSANQALKVNTIDAKGIYQLEFMYPDNKKTTLHILN